MPLRRPYPNRHNPKLRHSYSHLIRKLLLTRYGYRGIYPSGELTRIARELGISKHIVRLQASELKLRSDINTKVRALPPVIKPDPEPIFKSRPVDWSEVRVERATLVRTLVKMS